MKNLSPSRKKKKNSELADERSTTELQKTKQWTRPLLGT